MEAIASLIAALSAVIPCMFVYVSVGPQADLALSSKLYARHPPFMPLLLCSNWPGAVEMAAVWAEQARGCGRSRQTWHSSLHTSDPSVLWCRQS